MPSIVYLLLAIAAEIVGTLSLKASNGFTRLGPSVLVVAGYATAFFFVSLSLKQLNISTAYAIWAGAGTAGVAILGAVLFGESLRWPALLGIVLIIAGVVLVNYFGGAHA
jgi:small multidrug resistance pump